MTKNDTHTRPFYILPVMPGSKDLIFFETQILRPEFCEVEK